jgi:hypothetical protein
MPKPKNTARCFWGVTDKGYCKRRRESQRIRRASSCKYGLIKDTMRCRRRPCAYGLSADGFKCVRGRTLRSFGTNLKRSKYHKGSTLEVDENGDPIYAQAAHTAKSRDIRSMFGKA